MKGLYIRMRTPGAVKEVYLSRICMAIARDYIYHSVIAAV